MRLKSWHCISLLFIAVISAYFLIFSAGYNSVDDWKMITSLENSGPLDIVRHFLSKGRAYYYRPITTMTYAIDHNLWGTIPSFMHLENVLLHFFNAVLVFLISRCLVKQSLPSSNRVALVAALLFALHPLTTESVCWISGRSDLLAGFFLLLSVWLLILGLQQNRWFFTSSSGISLLVACLAKEVSVFILPGLLWFVAAFPAPGLRYVQILKQRWLSLTLPSTAVTIYFVMRYTATVQDNGVRTALKGVVAVSGFEVLDKLRIAFKVYGFYFKKFFLPWPLNFGIIEISDGYVVSGVIVMAILLWLGWRRDLSGAFCLMAFCVLSPALLVPFGKMAWTPLAERYLYIPIALAVPAISFWFYQWRRRLSSAGQQRTMFALLLVLLVFFSTTLHRSWIWQDNERLYRDTMEKSPHFTSAKIELASALMRKGKQNEAEIFLQGMQSTSRSNSLILDDLSLAYSLMKRGELIQVREILLPLLQKNHKQKYQVLQALLKLNSFRIGEADSKQEKVAIQEESLHWLLEEQKIKPSSFIRYRLGKAYYGLNRYAEALSCFKKSLKAARKDAHYSAAAEKFILRIEEKIRQNQ